MLLFLLYFSQYTSVEDAAASRRTLHGIKWPLTSPKILAVDFADEDEVGVTVLSIVTWFSSSTWL